MKKLLSFVMVMAVAMNVTISMQAKINWYKDPKVIAALAAAGVGVVGATGLVVADQIKQHNKLKAQIQAATEAKPRGFVPTAEVSQPAASPLTVSSPTMHPPLPPVDPQLAKAQKDLALAYRLQEKTEALLKPKPVRSRPYIQGQELLGWGDEE